MLVAREVYCGAGGHLSNLRTAAVGGDCVLLSVGVGAPRDSLIMAHGRFSASFYETGYRERFVQGEI